MYQLDHQYITTLLGVADGKELGTITIWIQYIK